MPGVEQSLFASGEDINEGSKMKCPKCTGTRYNVYSERKYIGEGGCEEKIQYRKCKDCGYTGQTLRRTWVCELSPEDYLLNKPNCCQ